MEWLLTCGLDTKSRDFFCGPVTQFERSIGLCLDYDNTANPEPWNSLPSPSYPTFSFVVSNPATDNIGVEKVEAACNGRECYNARTGVSTPCCLGHGSKIANMAELRCQCKPGIQGRTILPTPQMPDIPSIADVRSNFVRHKLRVLFIGLVIRRLGNSIGR